MNTNNMTNEARIAFYTARRAAKRAQEFAHLMLARAAKESDKVQRGSYIAAAMRANARVASYTVRANAFVE